MQLAEFARWAIENSAFIGSELDGADVETKAIECGILVVTKYDPKIHANSLEAEYASPGDPWHVFSDEFQALSK